MSWWPFAQAPANFVTGSPAQLDMGFRGQVGCPPTLSESDFAPRLRKENEPCSLSLPDMAVHSPSVPARWSHRRERSPFLEAVRHCDFILVGSALTLSLIGAVMVYSATRVAQLDAGGDPKYYLKRQLVWLVLGLVVMVVAILIDYHWLEQWAYVIYGLVLLSLVAVLTHFGHTSLGAQRWFSLGPLELQPSEFAALALIIVLAVYCARQEAMFPRNIAVVLVARGRADPARLQAA